MYDFSDFLQILADNRASEPQERTTRCMCHYKDKRKEIIRSSIIATKEVLVIYGIPITDIIL